MKTRLLILSLITAVLCGCSATIATSNSVPSSAQFAIGKATYISNYRIIQTLNEHFALAADNKPGGTMVIAVRTSEDFDPFYDEQIIGGQFVMIDTYTYETVPDSNGRTRVKTVPYVVPRADYVPPQQTITNRADD